MKEELITFETAKLAQEKGYTNPNNKIGLYTEDVKYHPYMAHWLMDYKEFYIAPTQSLLQKWLREVHNIDVLINKTLNGTYYYIIWKDNCKIKRNSKSNNNYQEILEDGLQEALKLIQK